MPSPSSETARLGRAARWRSRHIRCASRLRVSLGCAWAALCAARRGAGAGRQRRRGCDAGARSRAGQGAREGPRSRAARRPLHREPGRTVRRQQPRALRAQACGSAGETSAPPPSWSSTANAGPGTTSRRPPPRRRSAARSRPCLRARAAAPLPLIDLAGRRSRRWDGSAGRRAATAPRHATAPPGCRRRSRPRSRSPASSSTAPPSGRCSPTGCKSAMDLQVNLVRVTDNVVVRAWQQPAVTPGRAQPRALDRSDQGTRPAGR